MIYVYQDCKHSCNLACLASIAEIEMGEIKSIAESNGYRINKGMSINNERALSLELGLELEYPEDTLILTDPGFLERNQTYLITVPSINNPNGLHRLIIKQMDEGIYKYHDPAMLLGNSYGRSGELTHNFPHWFSQLTKVNFTH